MIGRLCATRVLLLVFVGLTGPRAAHARPQLAAPDARRIASWEVVSYSLQAPDGGVRRGKAIGRIAAAPEAVLHAILEIGKYKSFLPAMKDSREIRRSAQRIWGVIETALPWPARDAWVYVELSYRHKGARTYEARWKMINGTMKQYYGSALVEPWGDGLEHSVLSFEILAEPKTAAPDSVLSRGTRRVAEVFVHRLRMRVAALGKYGRLPRDLSLRYRR